MMRVLVIGGTRYLGRAIVERLAARGDEVMVANRGRTAAELPLGVARVSCDVDRPGSLAEAIEGNSFDAAVHMVAMNGARARSVLDDLEGRVGYYIQCGSTGIYMPLRYVPADEDHPTCPPPPDEGGFVGKWEADRTALEICGERELTCSILRPTNIIGAGDVPIDIWGARDPKFFQRMLDGKRITIPNDGQGLLQPGNVRDIADCFVLALDRPEQAGIYNVSCRYAVTHDCYVQLLGEALDVEPRVRYMPTEKIIKRWGKKGKVNERGIRFFEAHMCFTVAKAERELGYDPKMTPEMSVEETVRWMLDSGIIEKR